MQNAYYEGYACSVEVTNLFVFTFKGELIHDPVYYPGSLHDNKLTYLSVFIYPKLWDDMTSPGYAILGDSAFVTRSMEEKVVRARKTNESRDISKGSYLSVVDMIMQRVLPSERQSAEWVIRALKRQFGTLPLPLSSCSRKRYLLL